MCSTLRIRSSYEKYFIMRSSCFALFSFFNLYVSGKNHYCLNTLPGRIITLLKGGPFLNKEIYRIVGLIYGAILILLAALEILYHVFFQDKISTLDLGVFLTVFLLGILLVLLSFVKSKTHTFIIKGKSVVFNSKRFNTLLQFWILAIYTAYAIFQDTGNQYPLAMIFATFIMGIKYRLMGKRMFITFIVLALTLFQISALLSGEFFKIPFFLLHGIFLFSIVILFYQEEFFRHFTRMREYQDQLLSLRKRVDELKIDTIELSTVGLTPRETEVLKVLCLTHGSNNNLAESMDVSIHTIKTHIKNIFDKTGVDDRHQLIDLFRANF
jgi:DNA-binding CsgD family transcriptional regulator